MCTWRRAISERMAEVLRDTDLIIVSGDLTNFGGVKDARKVIDDVRRACPHLLALPGNLDLPEVTPFLEAERIALHGKGIVVDGVGIFGCGGSNITPFNTPTELTEDEIYQTLRSGYAAVQGHRPLLMVCHTPPHETKCDRIVGGKAVGSPAARRFIEEVKPDLCISGHIHECPRRSMRLAQLKSSTQAHSRVAAISSSMPKAHGSRPDLSFFEVPQASLAAQSIRVWGGKLVHGWPLVLKNSFRLINRFVLGRMRTFRS